MRADSTLAGVRHGLKVSREFGSDEIQRSLCHGEVVGFRQMFDPVHGHLPVKQGQERSREENDDEAGHRIETQQFEHVDSVVFRWRGGITLQHIA
ncbi:MAG: hypothetical protein M0P59_05130 [Gallionella sp.]|nr:hypothetical protein [Gallionella sp.]